MGFCIEKSTLFALTAVPLHPSLPLRYRLPFAHDEPKPLSCDPMYSTAIRIISMKILGSCRSKNIHRHCYSLLFFIYHTLPHACFLGGAQRNYPQGAICLLTPTSFLNVTSCGRPATNPIRTCRCPHLNQHISHNSSFHKRASVNFNAFHKSESF